MRRDADIIGYMYNDTEEIIREKIAKEIESISLDSGEPNSQLNALGMRILAAEIARGRK